MSGDACSAWCGYCGRCTHGVRPNAICSGCGEEFYKGADDEGSLCDRCCDERDADSERENLHK